ncbi:MAG: SET domain-containing protein [Cytophagaceae bacterium]
MKSHNIKVKGTCTYKTKDGVCGKTTILTHPYCNHHTKLTTGFYVAKSNIKGAGLGLFSARHIDKGVMILEYTGERLSHKEFEEKYNEDGYGSYCITLNKSTVIDACKTSAGIARYICDCYNSGMTPNVKYESTGRRIEITTIKKIKPGDELLGNYGPEMRRALGFYKKK